ncbi:amino acid-polyamine-organocation superfamily protein [Xanthomonas citri pv. aurantifolii str. ICPB 11122]|nr:amino acid-polyamine-organocation superfamily protein [Xanthomonas citri pv. aurantifolii str. ICPB 11122]
MSSWLRRKSIDQVTVHEAGRQLVRSLSWPHLIALGIGAIVGTGIYTLIGVGADKAGPAVLLSFVAAGIVCACAALAYAEMATMMPAAGSAYTYSYTALGESIAWVVGWSLVLEYSLVVSTVAVGWSGYFVGFLQWLGVGLPHELIAGPHAGGIVNLPAVAITFLVAGLLMAGTEESATLNAVLVVLKIIALGVFVAIALPAFNSANLQPFMPYGFSKAMGPDGVERGVMAAAAIIFFAFYGFDAISTAAEETKNPGRDLSIGIVGSMIGCTLIYVLVALAAVGAMSFTVFGKSPEPLALILRELGHGKAALVIGAVAIIALPTVLLAFLYGQSRIFFRDVARWLVAARLVQGQCTHRHASGDHAVHRGAGGSTGGRGPAGRNRRLGQRRHAGGVHGGGGLPVGVARARARPCARLPHAAGVGGGTGGDRRVPVSVLEPAEQDAGLVPAVECAGRGGVPGIWATQ